MRPGQAGAAGSRRWRYYRRDRDGRAPGRSCSAPGRRGTGWLAQGSRLWPFRTRPIRGRLGDRHRAGRRNGLSSSDRNRRHRSFRGAVSPGIGGRRFRGQRRWGRSGSRRRGRGRRCRRWRSVGGPGRGSLKRRRGDGLARRVGGRNLEDGGAYPAAGAHAFRRHFGRIYPVDGVTAGTGNVHAPIPYRSGRP